jgi:ribulose bisphosphate carboxylase small subunit
MYLKKHYIYYSSNIKMQCIAKVKSITRQVKSHSYRTKVRDLIKDALHKNKRITVISSHTKNLLNIRRQDNMNYNEDSKYENDYDKRINNMYEELTNEIFSDIEAQVYDYPEKFISLVTTDKNDYNINVINSYLIHTPE